MGCYGILGNNLLGMSECLSLKYYPVEVAVLSSPQTNDSDEPRLGSDTFYIEIHKRCDKFLFLSNNVLSFLRKQEVGNILTFGRGDVL